MSDKDNNREDRKVQDFSDHRNEVLKLLRKKRFNDAHRKLKQLQKIYKNFSPLFVLWGDYYWEMDNKSQTVRHYKKAIDLDKTNKEAYLSLAKYHDAWKEPDQVEATLWDGVRQSGDPLLFYTYLEHFHGNMENEEKAIEIVKLIEKHYGNRGEYLYKKGEAAFVLDLYIDAIDLLRRAFDRGYRGQYHYYYLAVSFSYVDHDDGARFFFKKSISFEPENPRYYDELRGLLTHKLKTGDQDFLTALIIKENTLKRVLKDRINLAYLISDRDANHHLKSLENYLTVDIDDITLDYIHFCEFYKNLILHKNDFSHTNLDALDSFRKSLEKLRVLGLKTEVTLYEGWHACMIKDYHKANTLFQMIINEGKASPEILTKARHGLGYVNAQSISPDSQIAEDDAAGVATIPLHTFGVDITVEARKRKYPVKYGLEDTVRQITQNVTHGMQKSIILTGPAGVGKTESIKQFAHLIVSRECPVQLKGWRIVQTSTTRILAGSKYIGMWEQKLSNLCDSCSTGNKIMIYLEDIANIFGAGTTEGSTTNFADFLLPRMEQNEILVLGEMESHQAEKLFWEHPAFERLVMQIAVKEPDSEKLLAVLKDESSQNPSGKNVEIPLESFEEIIDLTGTFMPYKAFPGKAIELLNRIFETMKEIDEKAQIAADPGIVISVFSELSGIPEFIIDIDRTLDSEQVREYFSSRILGQDEAVTSMINAVTAFKTRLTDVKKPIRSFLFVGPTGVGKTESAKVLASFLFGSQDSIIRLNMSEFNDYGSVSKLLGSHTGYLSKSSKFLDQVRRSPFSVILLDEIEKAHTDVLNVLLQLLDEGMVSDAEGKPAYFRSSMVIMTSNLGARYYTRESIGFGQEKESRNIANAVITEVKEFFSPEIFNRFDEVICFHPLTREVLEIIINREIGRILERRGVVKLGVQVDVDAIVKEHIVEMGYDPKYGARHIKRAVEKSIAVPLAGLFATGKANDNDLIRINMRRGEPVADVVTGEIETLIAAGKGAQPYSNGIQIADRAIRKTVNSIESRIESLKSKLGYLDCVTERDELQERMTEPTFWDDPSKTKPVLKRFSEVNRKIERIHKWEKLYSTILSAVHPPGNLKHTQDKARVRSRLLGLMKDLESAEMEILLEGKYDFADAFVLLRAGGHTKEYIKWLLELSGVYMSWTRRRGYQLKVFGEQPKDKSGGSMMLLYIGGMNAFGMLKNERGVHRKILVKKSGTKKLKKLKQHLECEVTVLADVQTLDEFPHESFDVEITKLKNVRNGMKIRSLSRKVLLRNKAAGAEMEFLSDSTIERDRNLPGEMFMSYLHYRKKRGMTKEDESSVWGTLVRTYDADEPSRIIDHRTRITFPSTRDYLQGKIDSLLLERIL
jgi:ATP-dependent Clp protease ATP-binding subunit ClpA